MLSIGISRPLCRLRAVSDLRSAPAPDVGDADHVRGDPGAALVVFYGDYTCPRCALAHAKLRELPLRLAFRHFAIAAKHPRAVPLACAAEAAARQDRFWEFHDSLFEDPAHTDDPHLWNRARALGLDLERFERDRRDDDAAATVRAQTRAGMRAGITETPTLLIDRMIRPGIPSPEMIAHLTG
jgi:protein-disulfide isomerase